MAAGIAADKALLIALYDATGGNEWTYHDGWMSAAPLREWWGVATYTAGRVYELCLFSNNLKGFHFIIIVYY